MTSLMCDAMFKPLMYLKTGQSIVETILEVFSLRSPSENPWQSSEMFGQCLETFVRPSDIFGESSEISGKQSGIFKTYSKGDQ